MNPMTGGSTRSAHPTYNATPSRPGQHSAYNQILHSGGLNDNAINGQYPTGSTFKPITALAALSAGVITPQTLAGAGTTYTVGSGATAQSFRNSGGANYGNQDLVNALASPRTPTSTRSGRAQRRRP